MWSIDFHSPGFILEGWKTPLLAFLSVLSFRYKNFVILHLDLWRLFCTDVFSFVSCDCMYMDNRESG